MQNKSSYVVSDNYLQYPQTNLLSPILIVAWMVMMRLRDATDDPQTSNSPQNAP